MINSSYVKNPSTLPISSQAKITNLSHTPMPKKFGDFFEISDALPWRGEGFLKIWIVFLVRKVMFVIPKRRQRPQV